MDKTTLVLGALALVLLIVAYLRQPELPASGMTVAWQTLWRNLPLLLIGFLVAGLIQVLVPPEMISRWLGVQAGTKGVLIACVTGGLVPGAPFAVFPLVATLYRSGASVGAVVGFVSAWSLWSVTRLPLEMALIDPKVALIRFGVTFLVPPVAGLLANLLAASR